jgi:hypothetical protein
MGNHHISYQEKKSAIFSLSLSLSFHYTEQFLAPPCFKYLSFSLFIFLSLFYFSLFPHLGNPFCLYGGQLPSILFPLRWMTCGGGGWLE